MMIQLAYLFWLIPLAAYDARHRRVPHVALVGVPFGLAALFAAMRGGWALPLVAVLALAASERHRLPVVLRRPAFALAALVGSAIAIARIETLPGALALIGFWLAYEAGWWAGVDGLAAMTLALLWPDTALLAAMGASHVLVAMTLRRPFSRPRRLTSVELDSGGVPGLPAIAGATALRLAWSLIA